MQRFRSLLAAFACLVVGVASFALSYVALSEVAVRVAAVPAGLGWLVPIVIDGGVICGSAIIWSLSVESARRPVFPFLFVGALVLVSVVVNVAHAGPTLLAKSIAALPPLILLGTLELVASQGRRLSEAAKSAAAVKEAERVALEEAERRAAAERLSTARELAAAEEAAAAAVSARLVAEAQLEVQAERGSVPAQRPAPAAAPAPGSAAKPRARKVPAKVAAKVPAASTDPASLPPLPTTRSRSTAPRQPRVQVAAPAEV